MSDEGNFFVVSLLIHLANTKKQGNFFSETLLPVTENIPA
jgi:hypothetical protein